MFTLSVKIAARGTVYNDGNKPAHESDVGHMWLSVDSDGPGGPSTAISMCFAPNKSFPFWQGHVYNNDDNSYTSTYGGGFN